MTTHFTFARIAHRILLAVALPVAAAFAPAAAQRLPEASESLRAPLPIDLGDRVLVRSSIHPGRQLEGVVMDIDRERMLLGIFDVFDRPDASIGTPARLETIPLSTIRTLHVYRPSRGVEPRGRSALGWALLGAGGGAIAGGIVMAVIAAGDDEPSSPATIPVGCLVGAAVGAGVGAMYGAARDPNPWQSVPLPRAARSPP
jgi:hypothetical protein